MSHPLHVPIYPAWLSSLLLGVVGKCGRRSASKLRLGSRPCKFSLAVELWAGEPPLRYCDYFNMLWLFNFFRRISVSTFLCVRHVYNTCRVLTFSERSTDNTERTYGFRKNRRRKGSKNGVGLDFSFLSMWPFCIGCGRVGLSKFSYGHKPLAVRESFLCSIRMLILLCLYEFVIIVY
jgi:hypothetical protein